MNRHESKDFTLFLLALAGGYALLWVWMIGIPSAIEFISTLWSAP